MYETHFGLRQRPFRAIPNKECYYPATSHERVLAQLIQAIHDDEGLALLTGEPGTGKTLVGHCLLDRLGDKVTTAFLTHSYCGSRAGLLQALLYDLSLPFEGKGEQELRLALTEFLLKNYESGRRTILVLDEAQNLTPELLEEVRMLSNLEGRQGKAFQVVLLAQPAILETLELPALAAFDQRLAVRARLELLGLHEAADYVVHHLRVEGGNPDEIVSDEALQILAQGTRGVPRLLNRAMNQALALACTAGEEMVDAEAAMEALAQIGLAESEMGETEDQPEVLAPESAAESGEGSAETRVGPTLQALEVEKQEENRPGVTMSRDASRARRLFAAPKRPA